MKKIYTFLVALSLTAIVFAQSPEKMSYQAVIRNSSNLLITNTQVGIKISILQGSANGTEIYTETQTPTTNGNGLVSVEIGGGTGFNTINWANGIYFIKTETDPTGGANYTISGTSQILSVPYALHSKTAESITGTITETDPVFEESIAKDITITDTANWNNKLDSFTETDPNFEVSVAKGISSSDTANWNTKLDSFTETDPNFEVSVAKGISSSDTANWNNKLDSFTETDPVFGESIAKDITITDTANWNNKLDSFTETDPVFEESIAKDITITDTANWNNKLDSFTETDPVFGESIAKDITTSDTANWNTKLDSESQDLNNVLTQGTSAGNKNITNLANPVNANDASTKAYVDELEQKLEKLMTIINSTGTVFDIDGNSYHTIRIGNQTWMAENLKVTKYSDGTSILFGDTVSNIFNDKPYYFNYDNLISNSNKYGYLYNYYAASKSPNLIPENSNTIPSGIQGACPSGWHLPSLNEWLNLITYLGGDSVAGGKLKSLVDWQTPNTGAELEIGFNALPSGGYDKLNYGFGYINQSTFYWSTTGGSDYFNGISLEYNSKIVEKNVVDHRHNAHPVRCIKN